MLQAFKNLFRSTPKEPVVELGPMIAVVIDDSVYIFEQYGRFYPKVKIEIKRTNGPVIETLDGCFNKDTHRFGNWNYGRYYPIKTFDENVLWFSTFEEANTWCLKAKQSKRHEVKPLSDCQGELHNTPKVVSSQFCAECNRWVEVGVGNPAPEWTEKTPCLEN